MTSSFESVKQEHVDLDALISRLSVIQIEELMTKITFAQHYRHAKSLPQLQSPVSPPTVVAAEQDQSLRVVRRQRRHFRTNGPIFPSAVQSDFVLAPHEEDLSALLDAITNRQFLIYHGPRQAGKTTRQLALQARLEAKGEQYRSFSMESAGMMSTTQVVNALRVDPKAHVVLLIDEFDLLVTHANKDEILRFLHAQYQATETAVICFGSFEAAVVDVTPSCGGSPFNCKTRLMASSFSLEQMRTLFLAFAAEYDVDLSEGVLSAIFSTTEGHRGLVTTAGRTLEDMVSKNTEAMQRRRLHLAQQDHLSPSQPQQQPLRFGITLELWEENYGHFANKVTSLSSFQRQRDRLVQGSWSAQDVYLLLNKVRDGACIQWGDVVSRPDDRELVIVLTDIGVLKCADSDGSAFVCGPPIVCQLVPRMFQQPLLDQPLYDRSERDILITLIRSSMPLVHAFYHAGSHKQHGATPKKFGRVPCEEAYVTAFNLQWHTFCPIASFVPQVKIQLLSPQRQNRQSSIFVGEVDSGHRLSTLKSADVIVTFPGHTHKSVIEFVAHEHAGSPSAFTPSLSTTAPHPAAQRGSVMEQVGRTLSSHCKSVVGEGGSLWVINCELMELKSKHVALVPPPGVQLLHVFHDIDFQSVEFV